MDQENQTKANAMPEPGKTKKQLWIVLRTVVIAAILGILAGAVGALIAFNYLSDYLTSIVTPTTLAPVSLTRVVSPGSLESAVELAEEKVVPAMVTFYKKKSGVDPSTSIYFENDILGYGLVFTSDGWLIGSGAALAGHAAGDVVAGVGDKLYEAENFMVDEVTGAQFVKISAENLPVVQLADDNYVSSGDRMVVIWGADNFESSNLINKDYNPLTATNYLEGSETVGSRLLLTSGTKDGAAIINYNAEVVGMVWETSSEGTIGLGLELLKPLMISLLKEGDFVRPYLGVRYIDLARVQGVDSELSQGRSEGALLSASADSKLLAVEEDSPAEEAGLAAGDIILSVNGQSLNSHGSLSRILLNFNPGDRLSLEILRAGETLSINLTLSALNDV